MQLDECRELCRRRKWSKPVEWCDKVSGAKESRAQLDAMMAAIRRGKCNVVVVFRFDRFSRSLKHLVTSLDEFRALSVDFVSVHDNVDTSTPAGRLAFGIIGAVAQFQRELIGENVRSGLARAKRNGQQLGRPTVLSPDLIAQAYDLRANMGHSWPLIAKTLHITRSSAQRAFLAASVHRQTLSSVTVDGKIEPRKLWVAAKLVEDWQPVIDVSMKRRVVA